MSRRSVYFSALCSTAAASALLSAAPAVASHTTDTNPAEVGALSALIPFPKDAIHAGLSWTKHGTPKICFGMRPSEYAGHHLAEQHQHPDAPADHDHFELDPDFAELVYGGFGFSEGAHGLDESVLKGAIERENFVCWDLTHADAFNDTGQFEIVDEVGNELVTRADLALNAESFTDAGDQSGLHYNIFCAGNVALADGRWLFIGGHDKSGNNGIAKLMIFDPVEEEWVERPVPAVKEDYLADPTGLEFVHADPLNEANTDPSIPSDMKYQRWYPTGVVLPTQDVLILGGSDQDTTLGPPGTQFFPPCSATDDSAACSKVRQAVPEIYSPEVDRTIALENAAKLHQMYPRAYVVQTGRGRNDWKVAVVGAVDTDHMPGLNIIGQYDPFTYNGDTHLLDVNAAIRDRSREAPAEKHWELVDTAKIAHDSGAGAQIWELDHKGHAISQKVVMFGGGCGVVPEDDQGNPLFECDSSTVEMIDFEDKNPQWEEQDPLVQPASQNNAVVLPNGKVVVIGGVEGRGPWENSFRLQLFDPNDGSVKPLVETHVARHDHSTVALLKDGSVAILGGNATDLSGEVEHLHAGIPVAQIYKPDYFFKGGDRPVVKYAPEEIRYHRPFSVKLDRKGARKIGSVVLSRIGPVTHNWDWGNRHVKLSFKQKRNRLIVRPPSAPGLAVPGHYMLFVVSEEGVPSKAEIVHLDEHGGRGLARFFAHRGHGKHSFLH